MEAEHQKLVSQMIASANGREGYMRKITKPSAWRGVILKVEEEDAKVSQM